MVQLKTAFKNSRLEKPTTWWDLLDFRFKKYLTPWIVRGTWILVCAGVVVWFLYRGIDTLAELAGYERKTSLASRRTFDPSRGFRADAATTTAAETIYDFIVDFLKMLLGALWIRVALETIIVLFNIASTLTSIDRKTKSTATT